MVATDAAVTCCAPHVCSTRCRRCNDASRATTAAARRASPVSRARAAAAARRSRSAADEVDVGGRDIDACQVEAASGDGGISVAEAAIPPAATAASKLYRSVCMCRIDVDSESRAIESVLELVRSDARCVFTGGDDTSARGGGGGDGGGMHAAVRGGGLDSESPSRSTPATRALTALPLLNGTARARNAATRAAGSMAGGAAIGAYHGEKIGAANTGASDADEASGTCANGKVEYAGTGDARSESGGVGAKRTVGGGEGGAHVSDDERGTEQCGGVGGGCTVGGVDSGVGERDFVAVTSVAAVATSVQSS